MHNSDVAGCGYVPGLLKLLLKSMCVCMFVYACICDCLSAPTWVNYKALKGKR